MGSPDRRIELEVLGDAHGTWDPGRMAQVISNLVSNAVAHGAPYAPVTVQIDATGDDHVDLSVHNEGPPIPPELLPVLFEPFRRGTGDKSPRGLGLGLYIVRQLVEAHGGTVDVRSTAPEGTTFTIELQRTLPVTSRDIPTIEAIH
jgi:signal transduction histidine kinase